MKTPGAGAGAVKTPGAGAGAKNEPPTHIVWGFGFGGQGSGVEFRVWGCYTVQSSGMRV